jgi:methylmalonyl-CoA/ethylmalonyl-CoA epimerase
MMGYPLLESKTDMALQLCFVTDDLDRTNAFWSKITGLPLAEIWYSGAPEMVQAKFKGEPTEAGFRQAFYRYKGTYLELMEPDSSPSAWRDWLDRNGPGFHHLGFRTFELDETIEQMRTAGYPMLQIGNIPQGGRYAYVDTEVAGNFIVELLEFEPELATWLEETYPAR